MMASAAGGGASCSAGCLSREMPHSGFGLEPQQVSPVMVMVPLVMVMVPRVVPRGKPGVRWQLEQPTKLLGVL
jgi:hypothetical protein